MQDQVIASEDIAASEPTPVATPVSIRRYVGPPGHQVHITEVETAQRARTSFYCLHATAYSGRSFAPFMAVMSAHRRICAVDTPGYGGSDRPAQRLDIPGYAREIGDAIELDSGGPIDLLGYHTGAMMAVELARQRPELVRRLVLIGVPFFVGVEREHWRQVLARKHTLSESLAQLDERWAFFITDRRDGVSLDRGFENFVDELRAYPFEWWAHEAAFTFDAEACFREVTQQTLILNPNNHLSEASRRAAAHIPNASLLEFPSLDHAIFDVAPTVLAEAVEVFVSAEDL
jgi:pimeloyl-ACP methyl ester carboxylesterase